MMLQQVRESACAGAHRRDGMNVVNVDVRGLVMERVCVACGGSGRAEHVDRTLPPPPCRLCHPEEAALRLALARATRTIVAARRLDAYQTLRAAIAPGDVAPPAATPALLTALRVVLPGVRASCT